MNEPEIRVRLGREADADGLVRAHEAGWDAALAPIAGRALARSRRVSNGHAPGSPTPPEGVQAWSRSVAERSSGW